MSNLERQTRNAAPERKSRLTDLLAAIIAEAPQMAEAYHKAACREMLLREGYEDYLDDAITTAMGLRYKEARRIAFPPNRNDIQEKVAKRAADVKAAQARVDGVKETILKSAAKLLLLDLVMPNGIKLRDCTGADCIGFGGWLTAIGKKVGDGRKVGDVLSEREIRSISAASSARQK